MRRLLTILAADVAGYSHHIEQNETATLESLKALRAIMDTIIEKKNGRIANTAGDSVLAWFESPVEAVFAAIEIQQAHTAFHAEAQGKQKLLFRIGLNIGDVSVQQNGDLLGHGVNIAASLEALADPGGICLSKSVMDHVDGKVDMAFSKVGEHRLKNVEQPVVVYSVGAEHGLFSRKAARRIKSALQKPATLLGFSCAVALVAGLALWLTLTAGPTELDPTADLQAILATDPSEKEVLAFFDLATKGQFEGHTYYILRTWGGTWATIERLAEVLGGYPVAITSEAENAFVYELSLKDEGHWIAYDGAYSGPMIGLVQTPNSSEPAGGWQWSNGETVSYTNWKRPGPDNWGGKQSPTNFGISRRTAPGPTWNDIDTVQHSVVVEVPELR